MPVVCGLFGLESGASLKLATPLAILHRAEYLQSCGSGNSPDSHPSPIEGYRYCIDSSTTNSTVFSLGDRVYSDWLKNCSSPDSLHLTACRRFTALHNQTITTFLSEWYIARTMTNLHTNTNYVSSVKYPNCHPVRIATKIDLFTYSRLFMTS